MQFNVAQREITLKVVYYGPPLSGKTTNLQAIHRLLNPETLGHLTVLNTADDRTLFFDLLPVIISTSGGYKLKLKLFTVPGQVIHAATRRLVLAGADGVVFVADSQTQHSKANNEYWHGMRHYMRESGIDPNTIPTVIQFNKRDLPNVRTEAELAEVKQRGSEPLFQAVAIRGDGVLETLRGLLTLMFDNLDKRYAFTERFHMTSDAVMDAIFKPVPPAVANS